MTRFTCLELRTQTQSDIYFMDDETQRLHRQPERRIRPGSPPPLTKRKKRPWKGMFLVLSESKQVSFLFFAGCLFCLFSYHHYNEYTLWELLILLMLTLLLFIPSVYFGIFIIMVELGIDGMSYDQLPQLNN